MNITTLNYCPKRNFLITGSREGVVMVFEMGKVGKVVHICIYILIIGEVNLPRIVDPYGAEPE
jgi:hypothetical protein